MIEKLYCKYPILKAINYKYNNKLEEHIQFKHIECDQMLKGDTCPGLIFIIEGSIKVERINENGEQTSLYTINEGELCHESLSCFLDCKPLEIIAYAKVDSLVAVIPHDVVEKYLLSDVAFMRYLYQKLYGYFRKMIVDKEAIIHESVEERLLSYLKEKNTSIIYTTHQTIAVDIGSSREVVSRKLKQFEKQGYLELGRGKIKLINKTFIN